MPVSLLETDPLGAPSTTASTTDQSRSAARRQRSPQGSGAGEAGHQFQNGGSPLGSKRPPDAMDNWLWQAGRLVTQFLMALTSLPQPWNIRFYMFMRPFQGLVAKISEI